MKEHILKGFLKTKKSDVRGKSIKIRLVTCDTCKYVVRLGANPGAWVLCGWRPRCSLPFWVEERSIQYGSISPFKRRDCKAWRKA